MYCRAGIVGIVTLASFVVATPAFSQALTRPTPPPLVTAESERWYLDGEPITHAGNLYYPAGAQTFFNPNEMVRSGFHLGIPVYTRTTMEPFSVMYVPVGRGLMQPYERRRDRELTGTAGSRPSSLITPYDPASAADLLPQSPAPPSRPPIVLPRDYVEEGATGLAGTPARDDAADRPAGTAGADVPRYRPMHTRIGGRPTGINAVYVVIDGQRWYSTGRSVEIEAGRMARIGEYKGFDVWAEGSGRARTLYIAVAQGGTVAVQYTSDPSRRERPVRR